MKSNHKFLQTGLTEKTSYAFGRESNYIKETNQNVKNNTCVEILLMIQLIILVSHSTNWIGALLSKFDSLKVKAI